MRLRVQSLDDEIALPAYQHEHDAGLDLRSRISVVLAPGGGRALIPTGVAVEIPRGHVGLICPRSGIALDLGLTVLNAPGVIDAGYRGEVGVIMVNLDPHESAEIKRGDRIAQLVVLTAPTVSVEQVDRMGESDRGASGFGDSGRA